LIDGNLTQVLEIPSVKSLILNRKAMHNTKAQRATQCKNQYGFFNKTTQYCIIMMSAKDLCVSIAKKEETGRWFLDGDRYN